MRTRRNADSRLQGLRRAMAAAPDDVQIQHEVVVGMVRAGELPGEAVDRLIPGRPVMPWQFIPASYVLLEAWRIGRETSWEQGRVEAEWIMGVNGASPGYVPVEGATSVSLSRVKAPSKFYVGFKDVALPTLQGIAGAPLEFWAPAHTLSVEDLAAVAPARWIPSLSLDEGCWAQTRVHGAHEFEVRVPRFYAEEIAGVGLTNGNRHDCQPHPGTQRDVYDSPYPDAHFPQMLLYASPRYATYNSRDQRWRSLVRFGAAPLLDVRLIKRARIMTKRGKAWKNPWD